MPRSRELRGVVVPDVDSRALRQNVVDPLSRAFERIGEIVPGLDLGSVSSAPGAGGGGQRRRESVQVAQLEVLEDIHETLRGQGGPGGGGNGFLSGLGVGSRLGGGGLASGLKTLTVGSLVVSGIGLSEILKQRSINIIREEAGPDQTQSADEGPGVPISLTTDPSAILQNIGEGLRQAWANASPQIRQTFLDAVTRAFSSSGSLLKRTINATGIGQRIAGGVESTLSSFEISEPRWLSDLRSLVEGLGSRGGGGRTETRTLDLSERASDQSLSFSERRSAQAALAQQRRRGESDTVQIESPTLNTDITIDASNVLNDLQRQVDRKLRELEQQVSEIESELREV